MFKFIIGISRGSPLVNEMKQRYIKTVVTGYLNQIRLINSNLTTITSSRPLLSKRRNCSKPNTVETKTWLQKTT